VGAAARTPIRVVRIERDVDFAAAYNAGIAEAQGEFIVLLNNDTIVTERWLEHLIALAEVDPLLGMVGPMSNHAPPSQWIGPVPYRFLAGDGSGAFNRSAADATNLPVDAIERFAREWREGHKTEGFETEHLAGFCVMIKRAALEKIGPMCYPPLLDIPTWSSVTACAKEAIGLPVAAMFSSIISVAAGDHQ